MNRSETPKTTIATIMMPPTSSGSLLRRRKGDDREHRKQDDQRIDAGLDEELQPGKTRFVGDDVGAVFRHPRAGFLLGNAARAWISCPQSAWPGMQDAGLRQPRRHLGSSALARLMIERIFFGRMEVGTKGMCSPGSKAVDTPGARQF